MCKLTISTSNPLGYTFFFGCEVGETVGLKVTCLMVWVKRLGKIIRNCRENIKKYTGAGVFYFVVEVFDVMTCHNHNLSG